MSASHCQWCSDPWRAALIGLVAKGLRACVIARHYGLRKTTVSRVVLKGRAQGCLSGRTCQYCPASIGPRDQTCRAESCRYKASQYRRRSHRAVFGWDSRGRPRAPSKRRPPPTFVWPELPPNPRERLARTPMPPPLVLKPAVLFGLGNRTAGVKARARLAAGLLLPSASLAVLPWQGPVAPPLCPTIGSIAYGRMAA